MLLKPAQNAPAEVVIRLYSAQPRVFCPGLFEDGDVWVGIPPEGEEVLVGAPGLVLSPDKTRALQLGRAFLFSGDETRARTAYQDFLNLWKDADPDIPILKQAKREYARLQ